MVNQNHPDLIGHEADSEIVLEIPNAGPNAEFDTQEARRERGFTLIEIMAVVLIMGLLMGLVGVAVFGRVAEARRTTTRAQITQLESALEFYRLDNSRYPTTAQGLRALVEKPSAAPTPRNYPKGGYLRKRSALVDAWGNKFQYASPGANNSNTFDIWSLAADGQAGGAELDKDIGNWSTDREEG